MGSTPVRVWLGPAGAGKTHRARGLAGDDCWVIVPSESTTPTFPKLASGESAACTFRRLAERITGKDPQDVASPALRAYLLREAVRAAVGPGDYFDAAAPRPGFAPAIGDLIREFKQAEVTPDRFLDAVAGCAGQVDDPRFREKCESITAIWRAYADLLDTHQTCDADDVLARAIQAVEEWRGAPALAIVDGFTAFTPQQMSLLTGLQRRGTALDVCLTSDSDRPVLFARTTRTLEEVQARLSPVEGQTLEGRGRHLQTGSLRHLEACLFAPQDAAPCDGSVRVYEAPDLVMEAEMVARAVYRLHHEGTPLRRIAVVQRRLDGAATLLKSTFARYSLPVAFHAGEPLAENPLVSVMTSLLRLFLGDWQREEVLRCAKSSYFGLPPEESAQLERWAITHGVRGGHREWMRFAYPPERPERRIVEWLERLQAWQERLRRRAEPVVFAKLIAQLAGDFHLTARAHQGDALLAQQDELAWKSARGLLREIARVETLANEGMVGFDAFADAALAGWASGMFTVPPPDEDHVVILEAFDARQGDFDAAFLMGLNERVFPRVVGDNPFLRDDEREALAAQGVRLPRQVELADEERVLFYRVITSPARLLVLSYARTGSDGRQTLPSYYLEEVRSVFADGEGAPPTTARTLADVVPEPTEAVGTRERVLCASAVLAGHRELSGAEKEALLARLAEEKPDPFADTERFLSARVLHALGSPPLRQWVQDQAADRAFSPSELETFVECPHRHFLSAQLHLREVSEDVGAPEIGSLLHAVLRAFLAECRNQAAADGGDLLPPDALERLEAILAACLPDYIADPRGWRVQMIRHAALEYLERFLVGEAEYLERTGLRPTFFELAFGPRGSGRDGSPDPDSRWDPLVISSPAGDVKVAGKMDRVDLTTDGQAAAVIDYKLSRGPDLKEMLAGKSLQMPLYLLAMEQVFGMPAIAAIYRPLRKGDPYWVYRPGIVANLRPCGKGDGVPAARYAELVEATRAAVLQAAGGIRLGECAPTPGDFCQFCPFPDICRPDEIG